MKINNIHKMYDQHTSLIMRIVLSESSSCIDVGAHVGEVLQEIVSIAPRGHHYAFEPIPYLFDYLKEQEKFCKVQISDLALSDVTGEATFFWVKNNPAYSGLKQRRYDIPNPDIVEVKVRKALLDDVVPERQAVDLIKIDVEGGELPVLRGAKRIITKNKPYIIFESGKGASDFYGTNGDKLYEFLTLECGLEINTLDGFLTGAHALNRKELNRIFDTTERYYFIAHRPFNEIERTSYFRLYVADIDVRLFAQEDITKRFDRIERALLQLQPVLPSISVLEWGATETTVGQPVNIQPNGSSAIWIRARNLSEFGESYIYFNEHPTIACLSLTEELVTAEIPQVVIQNAGNYLVRILEASGRGIDIGVFSVLS